MSLQCPRAYHRRVPPTTTVPFGLQDHAAPWRAGSSDTAVLLVHGITGGPASMRPWGEALAQAGNEVVVPLLPGHGTRWQDLTLTTWEDWYATVEREYLRLAERCSHVVVGGLSMGGALALRLAALNPVAGVMLVNPAIAARPGQIHLAPILRHVVESVAAIGDDIATPGVSEHAYPRTPIAAVASMLALWTDVRGRLADIHAPVLLFRSRTDHVVDPTTGTLLRAGIVDLTEFVLENSYHVATLDADAPFIGEQSVAFVERVSRRD